MHARHDAACGFLLHRHIDVCAQLSGLLIALLRVRVDGFLDDPVPACGDLREFGDRAARLPRNGAGEHFIKHDAGGEDVHAVIRDAAAADFRRGVVRRAQRVVLLGLVRDGPCQPEVSHLHMIGVVDHDVSRLDVTVDDLVLVGEGQRLTELDGQVRGLAQGQTAIVDDVVEGAPLYPLDHQKQVPARRDAEVIDSDDVRVVELGHRPGFALEAVGKGRLGTELGRKDLDGDVAVQALLIALVNGPHPAARGDFFELELREVGGHLLDAGHIERGLLGG